MNDFLDVNASIIQLLAPKEEPGHVLRGRLLVMCENLLQWGIPLDLISGQHDQGRDGFQVNVLDLVQGVLGFLLQ